MWDRSLKRNWSPSQSKLSTDRQRMNESAKMTSLFWLIFTQWTFITSNTVPPSYSIVIPLSFSSRLDSSQVARSKEGTDITAATGKSKELNGATGLEGADGTSEGQPRVPGTDPDGTTVENSHCALPNDCSRRWDQVGWRKNSWSSYY